MAGTFLTNEQAKAYAEKFGAIRPNDAAAIRGAFISNSCKTKEGEFAGYSWLGTEYSDRRAGLLCTDGALDGRYPDRRNVSLVRAFPKSETLKSGASEVSPDGKTITDKTRAEFSEKLPEELQEAALQAVCNGSAKIASDMKKGFACGMNAKGKTERLAVYEWNGYLIQVHNAQPYDEHAHTLDGQKVVAGKDYVTYATFKEFNTLGDVLVDRYGIVPSPFDQNGKTDISQDPQIKNFVADYDNDMILLAKSLQRVQHQSMSVGNLFDQLLEGTIDEEALRAGLKNITKSASEREGATADDAAKLLEEIKQAASQYANKKSEQQRQNAFSNVDREIDNLSF